MTDAERRELDMWLAEHLFCWERLAALNGNLFWRDQTGLGIHVLGFTDDNWPLVAEAMRKRGYDVFPAWISEQTVYCHGNYYGWRYYCQMYESMRPMSESDVVRGSFDSIGEAVCLAAKAALEAKSC